MYHTHSLSKRLWRLILLAFSLIITNACTAPTISSPTITPQTLTQSASPIIPELTIDTPILVERPTSASTIQPALVQTRTQDQLPAPSPKPTRTSLPTKTSTPTVTPYPALTSHGPYLVYNNPRDPSGKVFILDTDGSGRRLLTLPSGGYTNNLNESISPDGRWLAFYTGQPEPHSNNTFGPYDLTLHLMEIRTEQAITVTKLLSPDYPSNFDSAYEKLLALDSQSTGQLVNPANMEIAFVQGVHSLDWSPDSRTLAFAGQLDGLSSDLFIYKVESRMIQRLTSGPEQVQWIKWSPDGKWILHASANQISMGCYENLHAAAADGSVVNSFDPCGYFYGWGSSTIATIYEADNGPGSHHLMNINIETGQITNIWQDQFQELLFDPLTGMMIVGSNLYYQFLSQASSTPGPEIQGGLYLVYPDGPRKFLSPDHMAYPVLLRASDRFRFVTNLSDGVYGITQDGTIVFIRDSSRSISISPNYYWMVVYDDASQVLEVFGRDDQILSTIPVEPVISFIWRPDSQGLYLFTAKGLFYTPVPNGTPVLVEAYSNAWSQEEIDRSFTWIPGF